MWLAPDDNARVGHEFVLFPLGRMSRRVKTKNSRLFSRDEARGRLAVLSMDLGFS